LLRYPSAPRRKRAAVANIVKNREARHEKAR
jgi:hypothetical protein